MALGVRWILTARYRTARGVRNTALGKLFGNALPSSGAPGAPWPHGPNPSIINFIFVNPFSFPGALVQRLPQGLPPSPGKPADQAPQGQPGSHSTAQADGEGGFAIRNAELCPSSAA